MAGPFTIGILVVDDQDLVFTPPARISLREDRTHVLPIGSYFGQSTPITREWSVAETSVGAAAISNLGVGKSMSGSLFGIADVDRYGGNGFSK